MTIFSSFHLKNSSNRGSWKGQRNRLWPKVSEQLTNQLQKWFYLHNLFFCFRRRKLLYELNSTGKYFAFKEQLKNSVIKIVREKFLKTSALSDPDELQMFLSELYVFLQDELHTSLNEFLTIEDNVAVENNLTDTQQMKHFALEAEMNRNFDLAAYYYQEVSYTKLNNFFIAHRI